MPRPSLRETILDAAEATVIDLGPVHMTLDAVAEAAKVSKGGLLYHFPSKEALLEAMIARHSERIEQVRNETAQALAPHDANELMIEITAIRKLSRQKSDASAALLAVVANQPGLMEPFSQKIRQRFQNAINETRDPQLAAILFFAALGIHFTELLKIPIARDAQIGKLFAEMVRLARDLGATDRNE